MMDFVVIVLGVMVAMVIWTVATLALMNSKTVMKVIMKYYAKWFAKYEKHFEEIFEEEL